MKRVMGSIICVGLTMGLVLNYQACGRMPATGFNVQDLSSQGTASLGSDVELKSQVLDIMQKNCVACHNASYSAGTPLNFADDVNKLAVSGYVVAGNPQSSILYDKIASGQMPPGAPLSSAQTQVIAEWILALAKATPTPTPAPTATPVATVTPIPTATPKPTVTPAPTATPVPTATPKPTATPTPTPTPNLANAKYSYIFTNILQPKCIACHGNSGGVSYTSYAGTTSAKSVMKGNPNASGLYTTTKAGTMPIGGRTLLTDTETELIRVWILNGALNN